MGVVWGNSFAKVYTLYTYMGSIVGCSMRPRDVGSVGTRLGGPQTRGGVFGGLWGKPFIVVIAKQGRFAIVRRLILQKFLVWQSLQHQHHTNPEAHWILLSRPRMRQIFQGPRFNGVRIVALVVGVWRPCLCYA